jgi:putative restriction endonuclease
LLSIIDLLDRAQVKRNEIALTSELVRTFRCYFDVVRSEADQPSIENPFYFLSGDGFWTLERAGQGALYTPGNASSR